jgi:hypothetical protein
VLWPPNGRLAPVAVDGVEDPDGDPRAITITGITQNEPVQGGSWPDAWVPRAGPVLLRAERTGAGDGRVYRVAFVAEDRHGQQCAGTVTVCVPHDRGRDSACIDRGRRFNSTGRAP